MDLRRVSIAWPLLVLTMIGCDGRRPLGPSFAVVGTPASLTGNAAAFNRIDLTWQENSRNETGFEVHRSATGSSGTFTLQATTPPSATTYSDFGLTGSTQYCYKVRAFRTTGHKNTYSEFTNTACATTPRTPLSAAPSGLHATPHLGYAISVAWTDNSAVEDGVEAQRAASGADWSTIATLPSNATRYHDAALQPDITYWYLVRATKHGGTSGNSNAVQAVVATTPPGAPASADAVPYASTGATVYWLDGSSNEAGFRVERSTDGGASWVAAGTTGVDETAFWDQGLTSAQRVCYRVVAFNHVGDS